MPEPDSPYPREQSNYPRRTCPRCQKVIAESEVWCPYCGMDTRPAKKLSNGCVVAMIVVIGYPVLVFGTCLIVVMGSPSLGASWAVPFIVFLLPLILVVLLSWAAIKNRKP